MQRSFAPPFQIPPIGSAGALGSAQLHRNGMGLSLGAVAQIGHDYFIEGGWSLSSSVGNAQIISQFSSSGAVAITSPTRPQGTISVNVTPSTSPAGASAQVTTTAPGANGSTVTIHSTASSPASPPGNSISQIAYSPTAGGASYVALALQGDTSKASAFGLIYDKSGFALVGNSASGWGRQITTLRDHSSTSEQTISLGRNVELGSGWSATPRITLGYAHNQRGLYTRATYDVTAGFSGAGLPKMYVDQNESLSSDYLSLMAGSGVTRALGGGWSLSLIGQAGIADMHGTYHADQAFGVGGVVQPAVYSTPQHYNGLAALGRGSLAVNYAFARDAVFSAAIFVDYNSAVPTLVNDVVSGSGASGSSSTSSWSGSGQTAYQRRVVTRNQITAGISMSLILRF